MVKYRNVRTGKVYERPTEDIWLEASAGYARVEDEPEATAEDKNEGSND